MAIQLPPQAYTRDTFIQAYEWLQSQPPSIRELASSPDTLVSLYLQYRRRGAINTNPVSSQTFKQDLKSLAEGLKQFEGSDSPHPQGHGGEEGGGPPNQNGGQPSPHPMREVTHHPSHSPSIAQAPTTPRAPQPPTHGWGAPMPHQAPHSIANQAGTWGPDYDENDLVNLLDAKTIEVVRRVQMRLNLSNEKEALRLLIAMGFDRIREMLPRG